MATDHGPSIRSDETYEALRHQGASKAKAARIANAQANPGMHPSQRGGESRPYEAWGKPELYKRARELEVPGRSSMNKDALIRALRHQ